MKTVFVYGSLKQGFGNHRHLEGQELLGTGTLKGFDMFSLGPFPAIQPGQGNVNGELYRVDEDAFRCLDRLEGHPVMYCREPSIINDSNGEKVEAWVYVYQGMVSPDEQVGEDWTHEHLQRSAHAIRC